MATQTITIGAPTFIDTSGNFRDIGWGSAAADSTLSKRISSDLAPNAWLRYFTVGGYRNDLDATQQRWSATMQMSSSATGDPRTSGPSMNNSWEQYSSAIVIRCGTASLTVPGPNSTAQFNVIRDTAEPYSWGNQTNTNIGFGNVIRGFVFLYNRQSDAAKAATTLTFDDGVRLPAVQPGTPSLSAGDTVPINGSLELTASTTGTSFDSVTYSAVISGVTGTTVSVSGTTVTVNAGSSSGEATLRLTATYRGSNVVYRSGSRTVVITRTITVRTPDPATAGTLSLLPGDSVDRGEQLFLSASSSGGVFDEVEYSAEVSGLAGVTVTVVGPLITITAGSNEGQFTLTVTATYRGNGARAARNTSATDTVTRTITVLGASLDPLSFRHTQILNLGEPTTSTATALQWGTQDDDSPLSVAVDSVLVEGGGPAFIRYFAFTIDDQGRGRVSLRLSSTADGPSGSGGPDLTSQWEGVGSEGIRVVSGNETIVLSSPGAYFLVNGFTDNTEPYHWGDNRAGAFFPKPMADKLRPFITAYNTLPDADKSETKLILFNEVFPPPVAPGITIETDPVTVQNGIPVNVTVMTDGSLYDTIRFSLDDGAGGTFTGDFPDYVYTPVDVASTTVRTITVTATAIGTGVVYDNTSTMSTGSTRIVLDPGFSEVTWDRGQVDRDTVSLVKLRVTVRGRGIVASDGTQDSRQLQTTTIIRNV